MKASMTLKARLTLIALLAGATLPVLVFGQARERLVDWHAHPLPGNHVKGEGGRLVPSEVVALELVGISVEGRTVTPGQPFAAGEDWLRGLTVRVRNISGRPIKSIRVGFSLPEARYKEGRMGFSLEYGKELSTGIDYGSQQPVMPGEEISLARNERHYTRDHDLIAARSGVRDFSQAFIQMTTVVFDDGMVWFSSKLPAGGAHTN